MIYWYLMELRMLWQYSKGWALHYGVPGKRWIIIPMGMQAGILATAWLVASPIIRHYRPPVFKPWFVGRCHAYMRGEHYDRIIGSSKTAETPVIPAFKRSTD